MVVWAPELICFSQFNLNCGSMQPEVLKYILAHGPWIDLCWEDYRPACRLRNCSASEIRSMSGFPEGGGGMYCWGRQGGGANGTFSRTRNTLKTLREGSFRRGRAPTQG